MSSKHVKLKSIHTQIHPSETAKGQRKRENLDLEVRKRKKQTKKNSSYMKDP